MWLFIEWYILLPILGGSVFIAIILIAASFKRVPNDPPHVGLITKGEARTDKWKKEGWRIFFPPFYTSFIPVKVEKINQDIAPKNVRSSERAELEIDISVVWSPDKERLVEYLNSGGESGIKNILDDIIEEQSRKWAATQKWEEALAASFDVAETLRRELTGETGIHVGGSPDDEGLGILIHRLNVGTIEVKGELGKEAEKIAVEERQRESELIELEAEAEQAKQIVEIAKATGEEINFLDALEMVKDFKLMRETGKSSVLRGRNAPIMAIIEQMFGG